MSELLAKSQAAIGKRNRRAGKSFERKVAKKIARHFGWPWKEAFDRAGAGHEQSHDAIVLSPYSDTFPYFWECKYRQGWSFNQVFKDPKTFLPYKWFNEAVENTAIDNLKPALVFSSPHKPVYILTRSRASKNDYEFPVVSSALVFVEGEYRYTVVLLDDFLEGLS